MNNNVILTDTPFFNGAITDSVLNFKDTINAPSEVPTEKYSAGDAYKIAVAGTYAGFNCEVGDLLVAVNDGPESGDTIINADWTVIQANIDGAVTSQNSLTQNNLILGAGNKTIKDSGVHIVNAIEEDDLNVPTAGAVDFYYQGKFVGKRTLAGGEIFNDLVYNAANAPMSHVEGSENLAKQHAENAHVEGHLNTTDAENSHLEGCENFASVAATNTHLEGSNNSAAAPNTHVGGSHNSAGQANQTVVGTYNDNQSGTLFEVGNGVDEGHRSNAFEVYSDGHATVGTGPTNDLDVATKQYVDNHHDNTKLDSGNVSGLDTVATTIINAINELVANKQNASNVNTLNTLSKSIVGAINEVNDVAKGAQQAISYNNYETMITAFNALPATAYNVSLNIMILTLDVPDLWVSSVENTSVTYKYTTDDAFVESLKTKNYVQVGYYKLSPLETFKIDLSPFIKGISLNGSAAAPDNTGNINIPLASTGKVGLVKGSGTYGAYVTTDGSIVLESFDQNAITNRSTTDWQNKQYRILKLEDLDFAVKAAMTDNVGPAWTDIEQENARKRMGINMVTLTQEAYDQLPSIDEDTYYCIVES